MRVSVVICTWNRCALLDRTLAGLRALAVPPGVTWELLVVNNNCSDGTDAVLASYRDALPLRRVHEPVPGLSRARNAGVRAATGELLLFTDDDVQVDPDWLVAYAEAARQWPDAGYFSGAIRPRFAEDVPARIRNQQAPLSGMLCGLDRGPRARWLRRRQFPYGPNMALRREVLGALPFSEQVGRTGHEQVRGSESSLFLELQRRGVRGRWVPEAQVEHWISADRASASYLRGYYHGCGRAQVRLAFLCEAHPCGRIVIAALREIAKSLRWWWVPARHRATANYLRGQLHELRQWSVTDTTVREGEPE